jgi:hypothetical protein
MTTLQVEYTEGELLASHDYDETLVAGGIRCHGGFTPDGTYVSPRTKHRAPAIEAWQQQHHEQFGTELLDLPLDTWPEGYPNVAQARHLLDAGVPQPIIATLTRIGTVEGFGSMIRYSVIPDLQASFVEDVRGTAMAHLDRGLYEAHARDEAGYTDEQGHAEGGHKQMWFAARDIAFENPVTEDETQRMLERMGIASPGSGKVDLAALRAAAMANRVLPDDIDFDLESLIERMTRLLLIEISAFHTFAWAEELLDDPARVAGDGEAARLVSYIRGDETPHVDYLRTVLSEMRDRTMVGTSGRTYPGTELIGRVWDRALADSLGIRRSETMGLTLREVERAVAKRGAGDDVLEEFHALGSVRPGPDDTWLNAETATEPLAS